MCIVASELDSSTERIINYLSDTHEINAVTFHYFKKDNRRFLSRVFLIQPDLAEQRRGGKKRVNLTEEQLKEIADSNGVGELYSKLINGLSLIFDGKVTTRSSLAFTGRLNEKMNTVFIHSSVAMEIS